MVTLAKNGATYRTKCMSFNKAEAFRKCLCNNHCFDGVSLCISERAKSEAKYYVTFVPSNEEKAAALLTREQDKRAAKAEAEGDDYIWVTDDPRFWFCYNPHSGQTYEVSHYGCDCPDFTFRCRAAGVRCKHMLALERGLGRKMSW